jgi:hypothetical protein
MSIPRGDRARTSGETDRGTLEQYQRHITTESMMGNAHATLSLLTRSCKFLCPAHLVCLKLQKTGTSSGTEISLA